MAVIKPFHLSFNKQVLEHNNQFHFIASVTMGVRLSTGEALLEPDFLKEAVENMGSKPFPDVGMPKPCGEYLVSGNYYAPEAKAVTGGEVKVKIADLEKSLFVFGPRIWEMGLPSRPEPFTEMPIEYGLAFGGNGLDTNMDGIGYQDGRLPCIENPHQLISSPAMKVKPAGLSVLEPACAQRKRFLGTYDDNYLQEYFPGYPADFDWQFFLVAAEDQRIEGFYQGNEHFEIRNMHPHLPVIAGQLPGYLARCFVQKVEQDSTPKFSELPLNLDTLWFFPEVDLALLISRGGIEVTDDEAEQISNVLLALESPKDPERNLDYYQKALELRLNSDDVLLNNFNTMDLIPVGMKCAMQIFQENALSGEDKSVFAENMDAKVEAIEALVNEKTNELKKQGQTGIENMGEVPEGADINIEELLQKPAEANKDPDVEALNAKLELLLPGITAGDPKKIDLTKFSFDKIDEILAAVQALTDKKTDKAQQEAEKAREQLIQEIQKGLDESAQVAPEGGANSQQVMDILSELEKNKVTPEAPLPRLNARELTEKLTEINPDMTEAMQNLQALKEAGIDDENTRKLEKMIEESIGLQNDEIEQGLKQAEAAFRETYFMGAHQMRAGSSPHAVSVEQVAEQFLQAVSHGQSVAGGDWACIDLSNRVLDNLDLSQCLLEQVDLTGASLKNTNLSGAILVRSILNGADLSGANLKGANIGNVKAQGANFSDVNLTSAKLSKGDFTRAVFHRCHIEDAESLELTLDHADFSEASLPGLKLIDAIITGAKFIKSDMTNAMFLQCSLKDVDFQQAVMPNCVWADTVLDYINFDRADLTKNCFVATEPDKTNLSQVRFINACLNRVNFQGISMPGSDLSKASMDNAIFSGADLRQSDFSQAHAPQAQFRKANLQHSNLTGINLMEGSLAKARLSGATFSGANLYSVDFLRSVMGETDFSGCNLDNTLIQDWQPS